jgi:hypothetical protein
LGVVPDHVAFKSIATGQFKGKRSYTVIAGALRRPPFHAMSLSAQNCAQQSASIGISQRKRLAATGIRAQLEVHIPEQQKENRMKSRKLCAVVVGSLVVFAMSMPVMAQDSTQSTTTTTTRTPDQPTTKTSQSDKTKTKYNKHHQVKESKETQKTKTKTAQGSEEHTDTTTTTTTPQ